jgi:hypothetical protein
MAQVPRSQEVTRAIRSLARQTRLATKEANQLAAKRLARGDYAGAQSLINVAQAISAFGNEVLELNSRWREVRSTGKGPKKGKDSQTPLWEFYRPILQALVSLDGDATRKEIEGKLEETLASSLKDGDFVTNAHGLPRWKVMVGRARKHMIAEGFVTGDGPLRWKITSKGEQAAKSGVKSK